MWDTFFSARAHARALLPTVAGSAVQATLQFEVFVGPDRTDFHKREPSFPTLAQASRWAAGFCDGAIWRVRSTATGHLVFDSEHH
ncbi:MAG: hypothetical protein JWQ11_2707 [Rhizobacter sp.]|nr:hypothetical protein [Rhizobacter sp.]